MVKRLITYSYPDSENQARIFRSLVEQDNLSPYETVDFLHENIESLESAQTEQVINPIELGEIMTIHNKSGMRDILQTDTMVAKVRRGDQVMNSNGLPNIKIVLAPDGRYLVFDGHHTALAYLVAGKKYLHQAPHIIISNQNKPLSPEEISFFFPENKRELIEQDWQKYTVNWQDPTEKIELRTTETLGELLEQSF